MKTRKPAMLQWWRHAVVVAGLGCASSQVQARQEVPEDPRPWSILTAAFKLVEVQRTPLAEQSFGLKAFRGDSAEGSTWMFEDGLVRLTWLADDRQMIFILINKSDQTIRIPWERAALVDQEGNSQAVLHGGVKQDDCAAAKTPSVVVAKATLQDVVVGCKRIKFEYREWRVGPIVDFRFASPVEVDAVEASTRQAFLGKRLTVLLPIQVESAVHEYTFAFELGRISRTPCRPAAFIEGRPSFCWPQR